MQAFYTCFLKFCLALNSYKLIKNNKIITNKNNKNKNRQYNRTGGLLLTNLFFWFIRRATCLIIG